MEQVGRGGSNEATVVCKDDRGRDNVFVLAVMRLPPASDDFAVRVRNLSAGGLMAELPHPLAPDVLVEVQVPGIGWVAGRVAWQTEGRAGIAFETPIDPKDARWR